MLAIEAGCDGVLICSGDHDTQAAALEALVHAVESDRLRISRVEDALRRQQRAKERFLGRRRPGEAAWRRSASSGARPRRAPRHRRRDGALPVMLKPRALTPGDRLAIVAPASPFTRDEFDSGLQEIRRLGFVPVYDESVFARQGYVAGTAGDSGGGAASAWRIRRSPASSASAAATAARRCCRCSIATRRGAARKPFIGYSDLTSVLTFLTIGCDLVAFHGPMLAGRLGRGKEGYDRDSFEGALLRTDPMGELAPPALESVRRGEASGPLLGGTLTQLLASLGTPFAFDPPRRATCCFSTKSASARTGSIAWSRSCGRPVCWRARARSSSASCRGATSRRVLITARAVVPNCLPIFRAPSSSAFPRATRPVPR